MEPNCTINCPPPEFVPSGGAPLPESTRVPMEFLLRSWSASGFEVTKAIASQPQPQPPLTCNYSCMPPKHTHTISIPEETTTSVHSVSEDFSSLFNNQFSFASSQLLLDRIMPQSTREVQEVSPLTSGRLSHSSEPLNDSPITTFSHSDEFDDVVKYFPANNSIHPLLNGGGGPKTNKTVGRWLKERREKKKEETRTHNAQLHATISVAAVAAAIAAIKAATAAADEKTDTAVASAATLVAAQCVEAAEAMGAERAHLVSVISSAVNVRSHDHITTLTAAAATAQRGAATLKVRTLKEIWNVASLEKGMGGGGGGVSMCGSNIKNSSSDGGEIIGNGSENFPGSQELLAKGGELLKRTRNGDMHWKIVSVYIHRTGQVMLKMKSKHVAGTITKKNKNVVLDVCTDLTAWPGRYGEKRCYFGLKTESGRIVEFECINQREYDIWTQGVSRLLSIAKQGHSKY